jgi:hypothetical protein
VVGKATKSHGARSEFNSVDGFEKVNRWNPIRTTTIQSRYRPMRFMGFYNHEKELRVKKFRSNQRSAARSREVGGALWEVYRLPSEVLRKRDRHCTSTKFRLRVMRWVHELFKRPS